MNCSKFQVRAKPARNHVEKSEKWRNQQEDRAHIINERRLRWLGHVLRMEDSRIPRQATQWELRGYNRKQGRPRKNWMNIINQVLKDMDITWDEAEELTTDRAEWSQRVAHSQCTHLHVGWTKAKVMNCGIVFFKKTWPGFFNFGWPKGI